MRDQEADGEGLTCREVIGLLADFLESTLTEESVAELEEHLAECDECQAYLNTYRRTVDLTVRAEHVEMPAEIRRRLHAFLVRQLSSQDR